MGVKKNFFYSSVVTVSNYLFPLITYPYVSRTLGVVNIGTVNYIDSIINYFSLFSMMGISVLGVREIAAAKSSKEKLSSVFFSLLTLSGCAALLAVLILLVIALCVPYFSNYTSLLLIGCVKLLGTVFLIDWFFKGVENFKYITQRTIFIKILYVASVLLFVKKESDFIVYFALSSLMFFINALYNLFYVRKFVSIKNITLKIRSYLKPYFSMGGYFILTSMYTTFNVAFLGLISSTKDVGFYTTAIKLFSLILAFYTAFTGVMLPKMSSLYQKGDVESIRKCILKSVDLLLLCMLPVSSYCIAFASEIIMLLAGPGYEGAVVPFRILMLLLVFVGYDQIQVSQILIPMKSDKAVLRCSMIAALIGVALNVALVPTFLSIGSACVLFVSEMSILLSASFFVKRKLSVGYSKRIVLKSFVCFVFTTGILFYLKEIFLETYWSMFVGGGLLGVLMFVFQIVFIRNPLFISLCKRG